MSTLEGATQRRPFWVETPVGRMQASGTRFVVRLESALAARPERVRISVQEGAVALHPAQTADSSAAAWVVHAGDSADVYLRRIGSDQNPKAPR